MRLRDVSAMKTTFLSLFLAALQLPLLADNSPDNGYVAHEWGTFTSVQGADGIQLEWNPLITTDLPKFVYDRNRPTGDVRRQPLASFGSKSGFVTLQRMETPVIYFYSDRERTVDVNVKFPQGLITEWFPQVKQFGPFSATNKQEEELSRQSFLHWSDVRILPQRSDMILSQALPNDPSPSHYFAARETDANFLQFTVGKDAALPAGSQAAVERESISPSTNRKVETEKFLFYRGIGNFQAPLTVTMGGDESYLQIHNTGTEALGNLLVLSVRQNQGKFYFLETLTKDEPQTIKLDFKRGLLPRNELKAQVIQRMTEALVNQGLYPAEAKAMVKTWEDSWFEEEGLRVLYILPRTWTDHILPLTLEPKPRELVRVMVGRAELITPSVEWELMKQIVHFSEADEVVRPQIAENVRKLGLGRFAEAATRRLMNKLPSRQFNQVSWELLAASAKPAAPKSLAQK
jgi:hypothetical protein